MDRVALLAYDEWATNRLLESVSKLSPEQFAREFAGELTSVRQQAWHLVSVRDRYRARLMGEPVPDRPMLGFNSPADLVEYSREVDRAMERLIASVAKRDPLEEVRHETRRGTFVTTLEGTLLHIVNHGTYHRGQIACLLKLMEIEPADTDQVFFSWRREDGGVA